MSEVLATIHARGWFDTSRVYAKNIYLSQGASLSMVLTRHGRPDTFVKFSDLVDLEIEAERCAAAARAYPDHAPHFVGYARSGVLNLLVTRAVDFAAVTVDVLGSAQDAPAVREGLIRFFQRARSLGSPKQEPQPRPWWRSVHDFYREHPLRDLAEPALDELGPLLCRLPSIPQHGDLVMNNLGICDDRQLVVFDWEDFGAVALPGLDLFTLEYSFGQAADWARAHGRAGDLSHAFDPTALQEALGLDPDAYSRLRLPCALVFRYLKRNYGPDIQARLEEVIQTLGSGKRP
ncbi:MAG: hypothetical protein J0L57_01515 [Burkholderiales bacterium]|nr:hypothetical protein [Burkholderiales bacterium]